MDLKGSRVLVTGGAGFIGSHLTRRLIDEDAEILVIDNLFVGKEEFIPEGVKFKKIDIRSKEIGNIIKEFKPDIIIHLAALHFVPYCNAHPDETFDVNVMGTRNLLKWCNKLRPHPLIFFASSAAVYPPLEGPLAENMTDLGDPIDIYGKGKLIGEEIVRLYFPNSIIGRIFNVYGPNDTNPHLIPEIIRQLQEGKRTVRLGNIAPKRDYIHVNDVCEAIITLIKHGKSGIFNIGTGIEHSVKEVIKITSEVLGEEIQIVQDEKKVRKVDREHLVADISKIRNEVGWKPKIRLKEGIKELIEPAIKV